MDNLDKKTVCELLVTKAVQEVSDHFGVTKCVMQHFMHINKITVLKSRIKYAEKTLSAMDKKFTIAEMVEQTGFSRNKVTGLIKKLGIKSKFSNQPNK